MNSLLFLVIVSVVIKYTIDPIKKLYNWIIGLEKGKAPKIGILVAFVIGCISGLTANVGIVESLINALGIEFVLNDVFHYTDVFFTCMLLTGLSGGIMAIVETLPSIILKVIGSMTAKN